MISKAASLLLLSSCLFAAEFRTGQAARAVLGQSSFSGREGGVSASSLVVAGDRLYAADSSGRTYTFDLSVLGGAGDDRSSQRGSTCAACIVTPIAQIAHSVMPGVAAVSTWGKTVAIADAAHHNVLIWRDATAPKLDRGPDLVLGGGDEAGVDASTLIEPVSVALDGRHVFVGDAALHRVLVWNSLPASNDQPADEVLGQPDFASSAMTDVFGADSVGIPAAMASNGSDLFVADERGNRILVFSPADAALAREQVANAASLNSGPVAPGTLMSISGKNFGDESVSASDSERRLPRQLGGVEAIFDGVALPLISVDPQEIEALIPADLASRSAASFYLRIEHGGIVTTTSAVALKVVPASPGVFASGGSEPRPGLLLHGGESAPVTKDYPAHPGEVLTVWATGLGPVLEDGAVATSLAAQIDGQSVSVISAKLAEHAAGVYEVQIALPAGGRGTSEGHLTIAQNGLTSNVVTFPLRPGT